MNRPALPRITLWSILILLTLVGMVGCETTIWEPGEHRVAMKKETFSVEVPAKWMRYTPIRDEILLTTDGTSLQRIQVNRYALDKAMGHSKAVLTSDMLPLDLAAAYVENLKAQPRLDQLTIGEMSPAVIDGHQGFRLEASYRLEGVVGTRSVIYGFVHEEGFYRLLYVAAERHYFEKDLATFEQVVASFKRK